MIEQGVWKTWPEGCWGRINNDQSTACKGNMAKNELIGGEV